MTISVRLSDEDEYDLECYNKAIKEYKKNSKKYTLNEVKEELGL